MMSDIVTCFLEDEDLETFPDARELLEHMLLDTWHFEQEVSNGKER